MLAIVSALLARKFVVRLAIRILHAIPPEDADKLLDKTGIPDDVRLHVAEVIRPR